MGALGCSLDDVDCLIGVSSSDLQSAFTSTYGMKNAPCRDFCQISPAVDEKFLPKMIPDMYNST